jgi:anthranilate phosphoribosyltransferase
MSEQIRIALASVVEGRTLDFETARVAMGEVMDGLATPSQLAAFLVALRMRGETVDELAGFAAAMRERVLRVEAPQGTIDVVGTGGDGSNTFNISTTSALVVAAAGIPVAKHGNRAITSKSGAADVLDALGVQIDHDAASAAASLRSFGFAFLFAPVFHPAMRHAGPTRREIGVRTAFNLLGPLTNPAGARRGLVGVGDAAAAPRVAEVAQRLGTERTLVVHGSGVDELPLDGSGVIRDVTPEGISVRKVDPGALGLRAAPTSDLRGGSAEENAALTVKVLEGHGDARRDVVLLNAGAALLAAGRVASLAEGIALSAETIDAGSARELLERLRAARLADDAARAAAATDATGGERR